MTKNRDGTGQLFTLDDIKGNLIRNLQKHKKLIRTKVFTRNCNKAQHLVRQATTLDQIYKIVDQYGMMIYLSNGTKHMLDVLKANEACPHSVVEVLFELNEVKQVKCKACEVPIEFKIGVYVAEGPEGHIIGEFKVPIK